MKLKQKPEDFQVEELTDVGPRGEGSFALYRLEKRGWSTLDALQAIRRRWQLDLGKLSYGGLKDRHAQTVQYLTIYHGPQRGLRHHDVTLTYLGQVCEPYTSQAIRANRFRITLRDLDPSQANQAQQVLEEVRRDGLPNYFDDQRFGSVSKVGEFMARSLVLGQYERALHQALVAPYEYDRAAQKREKAVLRDCWGDWPNCKERLPRGHARSLIDYLCSHRDDFRGALARLRPELRSLYLSAYQSHLWNRMLARWLRERFRPEQLIEVGLRLGPVPFPRQLDEVQRADFAALSLPLPSARLKLDPADPRLGLVEAVLAEEGIRLEQMQVKGIRTLFFSKGERLARCLPEGMEQAVGPDECHPRRTKLILAFELPRGSYATLVVKHATAKERG